MHIVKLEELRANRRHNAEYVWTDLDVKKLNIAKENNLFYITLYNNDIYFINEKPCELLETLVEMYHPQDNQQPSLPIWKNWKKGSETIESIINKKNVNE